MQLGSHSKSPVFGIIGVTIGGNMGGQVMLEATLDCLRKLYPEARYKLFSISPKEDRKLNRHRDLEVVSARPDQLMITSFLASCLVLMAGRWKSLLFPLVPSLVKRVRDCDAMIDLAGISFIDGRGLPLLIYNSAICLPSFAVDTPHHKLSQAFGPFAQVLNRFAARFVLRRCSKVVARGTRSAENLVKLEIPNAEALPDVSFALELTEADKAAARALLPRDLPDGWIVVSPSRIVQNLSEARGGDYLAELTEFVRAVRVEGITIIVVPHSLASGKSKGNDRDCAKRLAQAFVGDSGVVLVDAPPNARVLRAMFGLSRCVITSRFHACVAAVSTGVPVITLAWGHKYHDLLVPFGLDNLILDGAQAKSSDIIAAWHRFTENESPTRNQVGRVSLEHHERSKENFLHLSFRERT